MSRVGLFIKYLPVKKFLFLSKSPAGTLAFGKKMGTRLPAGSIITLIGELGCGKTTLTRGICLGLGVPERQVNSPTFVLVNEYRGRMPVYHLDLYRIETPDVLDIGLYDYLRRAESGVMLIEWAEKISGLLPEDSLRIDFSVTGKNQRQLLLQGSPGKYDRLFREVGGV
ncbi:MAG: tRNA (adenosine(37)-N6)-threonylcarbamoyltransferase complex ATPase subunit type 1 TsaE [Chloroflexota bacterium]